jgi:putative ABC transport system substrate-binding protein
MKCFKKILCTAAAAAMLIAGCSSASSSDGNSDTSNEGSDTTIGIIQFFEHPALDLATDGFEDYLKENGYADAKIDYNSAQGEVNNCTSIAQKLVNEKVNMIYAVGTQAALSAANETKDIPIVISAVTNPEGSDLVESNDKPGNNVTGASDLTPVKEQIALLQEILPDAKTIGLLYCNAESNSEYQISIAEEACKDAGLETIKATVTDSNQIQQVIESLAGKVDAIYVPTDNLLADSMVTVAQSAINIGVPVICGEEGMVENGGLATYGINYYELGKLAGKMAVSILSGESKPEDMAIEYLPEDSCALVVNTKTAESLGLDIPQSVLDRAEIVGEEE